MPATEFTIDDEFRSLIPPSSAEELAGLEADLIRDGCRDALVVWKEKSILLDGHQRYAICQKHGLPFRVESMAFADRDAAADWVYANQLHRRNLTPSQRTLLIGERYNRTKKTAEEAGAMKGKGGGKMSPAISHPAAAAIAKESAVDEKTVRRAGAVVAALTPEHREAVRSGAMKIVEAKRQQRKAEVKEATALPTEKYRVIYADPPWKYGDQLTEAYGATKYHYPSMSIPELCAMDIKGISQADAVLFLWVTSPLLDEVWPIIAAWGFAYKSSFVWDKIKHNMGHYNSVRHELLLICTRGSCLPDSGKLIDSVQSIERGGHSEKPEEFRAIIDSMYTSGRKIELFARKPAKGWDSYGNDQRAAAH